MTVYRYKLLPGLIGIAKFAVPIILFSFVREDLASPFWKTIGLFLIVIFSLWMVYDLNKWLIKYATDGNTLIVHHGITGMKGYPFAMIRRIVIRDEKRLNGASQQMTIFLDDGKNLKIEYDFLQDPDGFLAHFQKYKGDYKIILQDVKGNLKPTT